MDILGTWSRRLSALVLVTAAGLLWSRVGGPTDPAEPVRESGATNAPAKLGAVNASANPAVLALAAAVAPVRDLPPGLTRAQWDALQAEMHSRPDGAAELQRLGRYLAWSETLRHFRAARNAGADASELIPLARAVDDGLHERLRRAEVSAAEARQIKSAILAVTVADEAQRAAQLRQWADAGLPPPRHDPRQLAFQERQAATLAAWSAQPPGARSGSALERELEALRRQSFADNGR